MLGSGDGRRVADVLLARGSQVPDTHFATLPDHLDYRDLDTPFPFVLRIPQWQTELVLTEALRARGVPVHYDSAVTGLEQTGDAVRVRAGGVWRSAGYLIGADGAHSAVRRAAGIDFPGTAPDHLGFVADVQLAEPIEDYSHHWNQDAGHASFLVLPGDTIRVFGVRAADVGLPAEEVRRRQAEPFTFAELTESLVAICGTDFGVHSPAWLARTSNSGRRAAAYRTGRVLLAGDAAHVHLPAGGQGLNVGVQDAVNLAWKLAAEVHGRAPERLITGDAGYQAERRPVADQLVASTRAQDALMHTFNPGGAALRDLFSGFIAEGGEFAREMALRLSGLAVAYPGPDGAHPLTGTRVPDLSLTRRTVHRELRPDRFLLLDFTAEGSLSGLGSEYVDVRTAAVPRREAWRDVRAVLVRPDGYVAHAAPSAAGLAEAIAAWTEPDHRAVPSGG
ncbi:FAD-dependent monooxygenase [Amycolatopsis ultiminotia]|uniref:FAD-dependent monooxygenase n=2 Tax=Amycolatopsis ultiminotia TaxID=543629 RepID=A0ABP6XLN7_9PSEU